MVSKGIWARAVLSRLHWRWILTALMTEITAILMVLGSIQYSRPNHNPNLFAPAHIVSYVLNGPASYTFLRIPVPIIDFADRIHVDFGSLPAVALFWFCLGWALERKLQNGSEWLIRRRAIRVAVFTILLLVELFLVYSGSWWLHFNLALPFQSAFRSAMRLGWRWLPEPYAYAMTLWALLGAVYFAAKLWGTARTFLHH